MAQTELQAKIIAMLKEGFSPSIIAKALKCSRRYVYHVARKFGIEIPARIDKQIVIDTIDVCHKLLAEAIIELDRNNVGRARELIKEASEKLAKLVSNIQFLW